MELRKRLQGLSNAMLSKVGVIYKKNDIIYQKLTKPSFLFTLREEKIEHFWLKWMGS